MSASYRLRSIAQRYGERTVLQMERLEITASSSLALIGPSGAGKSTLLRLLGLLESPTEGTVEIDGAAAGPDSPLTLRRQITLMFQRPLLLRGSVERNVGYGLDLRGQNDQAAVVSAIAKVGLSALSDASVQTLSGGERQRVALARALVLEPRVLLLDEPTAHLDPATVVIIEEVIKQLREQHGTTIIFATHNLHQVNRLAEEVLLLLDGKMIEYGAASKIMQAAHDPRTRAFIEGGIVY